MAISRIRGEQIRSGVLVNSHIAANAGIEETKLSVNWAGHYQSALESKKVVDFVQVGNRAVGGSVQYNLTTNGVIPAAPVTTSAGSGEGVITDAPYNKVIIRDSVTGDSILDAEGEEVYGRLVHDGVDFKVMFYSPDLDGEGNPIEVAFTMPAGQEIDFQYMERFNLKTVSELFAANEKFVAGSADITAFQNIEQLAKDLYGAGYTLDRDGQGNLSVSIVQQIANEVQDRQNADQDILDNLAAQSTASKGANLIGVQDAGDRFLGGTVEAVLAEIKDALTQLEADLASNIAGEGASKIGIHDADSKFTADNVEDALAELADRAENLEQGSNAEVDNAKSREVASANNYFAERSGANATTEFTSLEERLLEIETVSDREFKEHDLIKSEVEAARGSQASLDARLDRSLKEDGTLKKGTMIHEHFRARYQAAGGEAEVLLSAFTSKKVLPAAFQAGDESLQVYINGQLQEETLNYQEGAGGTKIIFDLGDGTVLDPTDIVQINFYINNAE